MKVYYNEFDPGAAAWLRELVSGGLIPGGDVDTRSIVDVKPEDLNGYEQCHFFAGIGGWTQALALAEWGARPVWTGSCPCQPFSSAGRQRGEADIRHVWPEFRRLIAECRPPTVFGEQVASKLGRGWLSGVRADLEELGYAVGGADLCAAGVGAPHIRQRLFWVADSVGQRLEGRRFPELRERTGERVAGACGDAGGVAVSHQRERRRFADGEGGQLDWQTPGREQGHGQPESCSEFGGVGVADSAGWGSGESAAAGARHGNPAEPASGSGRLEHTPGDGRLERRSEPSGRGATGGREPSGVAEPGPQLQRRVLRGPGEGVGTAGERASDQSGGSSGAGFWSDYDLIPCRDGKVRRIEPGTFPLAHGVLGRVGLLRGYGNAIVPQVAAAFIRAANQG